MRCLSRCQKEMGRVPESGSVEALLEYVNGLPLEDAKHHMKRMVDSGLGARPRGGTGTRAAVGVPSVRLRFDTTELWNRIYVLPRRVHGPGAGKPAHEPSDLFRVVGASGSVPVSSLTSSYRTMGSMTLARSRRSGSS